MKKLAAAMVVVSSLVVAKSASAADPWVERRLTLPARDWAFDFGLGIGHSRPRPLGAVTGAGFNLEMAVAPIHHLELGLRTGFRFADDGRFTQADGYGRLFDHETYGVGTNVVANPEFRIRGELLDVDVFELALEGRLYVPIEDNTRFGTMFGVPLAIHIGPVARLDTGIFVPVLFYDPNTIFTFSIPFDAWFQVGNKLWLGPNFAFRHTSYGSNLPTHDGFLFGFGLGYQVASFVDLKTQLLFPDLNVPRGGENFGVGFGVQLRIE